MKSMDLAGLSVLGLLGAAILSGCGGGSGGGATLPSATPTPAATPRPAGGQIVFRSNQDGPFNIYLVNADGSSLRRLTSDAQGDADPALSPDGSKIAFSSFRDESHSEIYVMNLDGSGLLRLTNNVALDMQPAWSSDGQRIAFTSARDGNLEIYSVSAAGGVATNLTNSPGTDLSPAWSPDGTKIAFTSARDNFNSEIYLMNANGSGQTDITNNPSSDTDPAWSPDGSRIAFASNREPAVPVMVASARKIAKRAAGARPLLIGRSTALFSMKPDGSDVKSLTPSMTGSVGSLPQDTEPVYAPDGSKIAFRSKSGISIVSAAGGAATPLSASAQSGDEPDWR